MALKITIVAVGKLKERHWRDAADEYLKRLKPYATIEVVEVPDRDVTRDESRALAEEGAQILKSLPDGAHVVALDIEGKQRTSEELSNWFDRQGLEGRSHVAFVIGGAAGLAPEVRTRSSERLSFGKMTLPHQLARVLLLEQIYRSYRISRGEPYHR